MFALLRLSISPCSKLFVHTTLFCMQNLSYTFMLPMYHNVCAFKSTYQRAQWHSVPMFYFTMIFNANISPFFEKKYSLLQWRCAAAICVYLLWHRSAPLWIAHQFVALHVPISMPVTAWKVLIRGTSTVHIIHVQGIYNCSDCRRNIFWPARTSCC